MRDESQEIVIVSAARTPVGKFQGVLSSLSAIDLGAIAIREAVTRAAVNPKHIDECLMGCVLASGLGQNPARHAALRAGLDDAVSAATINMVCGSGLKAVSLAAHAIAIGDSTIVDSLIRDGLWCACEDIHMGTTAELVAEKFSISREEQDAFALESHRRASLAQREGRFTVEITSVTISATPSQRNAEPITISHDESIRDNASLASLAALRPAFKTDGTVTAGNAPGLNDAAAAVVVMSAARARALSLTPLATIRAQATTGVAPRWVMLAPITGVQKVLARAGWPIESVDLFELNEAFSVQAIAVARELGLSPDRVNVNGGAVAIGHPIGASGARILVTLLHEMQRRDVHRGIAALCLGGGNSVALAVER